ncbi:hypothetical protein GA0115255_116641, partial [Streptomyces sp. Ncost-T6T-2b]
MIRVVALSASAWKALKVAGSASTAQFTVEPSATVSRAAGAMSWGTPRAVSSPPELHPASTGIVSTPAVRSASDRRFRTVPRGTPTWDMAEYLRGRPGPPRTGMDRIVRMWWHLQLITLIPSAHSKTPPRGEGAQTRRPGAASSPARRNVPPATAD